MRYRRYKMITLYLPPRDERKISPPPGRGRQVFLYLRYGVRLMPPYTKPPLSAPDMVKLLQSKGLVISDEPKAQRYLNTIGYYRLSAYFIPFYSQKDTFQSNVSFDDVLSLYIFDRKLRLLTLDPVQRIEVAVRTAISNHMSLKYDPFWILDCGHFEDFNKYHRLIGLCLKYAGPEAGHSQPCRHYFTTYGEHPLPPSWMLIEELPMDCWSKLFANLKNKQDKRAIADQFQFSWRDFASWLQTVTVIRNILAHHRRFWNVTVPIKPANMSHYIIDAGVLQGAYISFAVIRKLFTSFTQHSSWHMRLAEHMKTCPLNIHNYMYFPVNWQNLPFWS